MPANLSRKTCSQNLASDLLNSIDSDWLSPFPRTLLLLILFQSMVIVKMVIVNRTAVLTIKSQGWKIRKMIGSAQSARSMIGRGNEIL